MYPQSVEERELLVDIPSLLRDLRPVFMDWSGETDRRGIRTGDFEILRFLKDFLLLQKLKDIL